MDIRQPAVVLLYSAVLAACGDPTGPVDQPDPGQTTYSDAPRLPVPDSPVADAPPTSDTLTVVEPLATHYRPLVERMRGQWNLLRARECIYAVGSCLDWVKVLSREAWSDELPTISLTDYSVDMDLERGRVLFMEDGTLQDPVTADYSDRFEPEGLAPGWEREHSFSGQPLPAVYLRRDRYWELLPISGGVGDYLLLTGETEAELTTTYTSGTIVTETETFGRSVTVSTGAGAGGLSAEVSATLSETYSTSVAVTESRTEEFSRIVRSSSGTTTRFMIWGLVERYTFTDALGEPISHPDYEIVLDELFRRSVATWLQAIEFPAS
jgi:hypothetical protein